jgi:ABC-type Fe3+-hydroxamate transport system substrate-binding protein
VPRTARDDVGRTVTVPGEVRRIVSLVPSLTETVASSGAAHRLVGVTEWCTHPADVVAGVAKVGGTKNPDVAAIVALAPDLVLTNEEENREEDVDALVDAGLAVWVTNPRTVQEGLTSIGRLLGVCGLSVARGWWRDAVREWPLAEPELEVRRRAFVPIWRKPWMALGSSTFAGDVLSRLGVDNVLAEHRERYPKVDLDEVRALGVDLVVLPDEPYAFTQADAADFADWGVPVAHVSGRHLTWYGPSLLDAREVLGAQLAAARTP